MWSQFAIALIFLVGLLYIPGGLIVRAMRANGITCLVYAPVASVTAIQIVAVAYEKLSVSAQWYAIVMPIVVVGACAIAIMRVKTRRTAFASWGILNENFRYSCSLLAVYILFAIVITTLYYVLPLDGPNSFNQDHDNVTHLNLISGLADSGNYSTLSRDFYYDSSSSFSIPMQGGNPFYPAGWHAVGALLVNALGVSAPLAENALNTVFLASVLPVGFFSLLGVLYPDKSFLRLSGAVVCLGFAAFPWRLLTFGPLYPNLAGLSFVAMSVAAFVVWVDSGRNKCRCAILFAMCLIGMAVSHPNAVFTTAVVLLPFVISRLTVVIMKKLSKKELGGHRLFKRRWGWLVTGGLTIVSAALWLVLYKLPFLQSTVSFAWPSYALPHQALIDIVTFAFNQAQSQIVLSILVIAGAAVSLKRGRHRWLVASFALAFFICFVAATDDGMLRHIVSGFWYTDPYRVAATLVIVAIPLVCVGVDWLCSAIRSRMINMSSRKATPYGRALSAAMLVGVLIVNYYPSYSIPGVLNVNTAFGDIESKSTSLMDSSRDNLLSPDERGFLSDVLSLVGDEDLILNMADDGSAFAHALYGLNVYYRFFGIQGSVDETQHSKNIRLHLNELADNESVQEAVSEAGAKYVLVLDQGGDPLPERCFYGYYDKSDWSGFASIDDQTPGLEIVLSQGDMRLYRIA